LFSDVGQLGLISSTISFSDDSLEASPGTQVPIFVREKTGEEILGEMQRKIRPRPDLNEDEVRQTSAYSALEEF
jgi:hypothetical protein